MKNSYIKIMMLPLIMMTMTVVNAGDSISDLQGENVVFDAAVTYILPDGWKGEVQNVPDTDTPITEEEFMAKLKKDGMYPEGFANGSDTPLDQLLIPVNVEVDTDDSELVRHLLDNIDSLAARNGVAQSAATAFNVFSHTVLTLPDHPRNEEAWGEVITNQTDWESFFYAQMAHITYLEGQAPIAIEIDFEQYQVLTGGLGVRSNGGYSLIIQNVSEFDDFIQIGVLEIRPSENCLSPEMISYPSVTVIVKKSDKPFNIIVTNLIDECVN